MGVTFGVLMATPAFAVVGETVTGTVNVDAERDCVCELQGFNADGIQFINFDEMGINGEADAQQLTELGLFCNLPADVSITSINGYLRLNTGNAAYQSIDGDNGDFSTPAAGDFAAGLDYQAEIVGLGLTGDTSQIDASSPEALGTIPPQNQSGVTIEFTTLPGTLPLIAGDYSDTLVVSITPQAL